MTRKAINPDWLAISKRTACSYGAIEYFATRCAYYRIQVPDSATIEKLIVANLATNGDAFGAWINLRLAQRRIACSPPSPNPT